MEETCRFNFAAIRLIRRLERLLRLSLTRSTIFGVSILDELTKLNERRKQRIAAKQNRQNRTNPSSFYTGAGEIVSSGAVGVGDQVLRSQTGGIERLDGPDSAQRRRRPIFIPFRRALPVKVLISYLLDGQRVFAIGGDRQTPVTVTAIPGNAIYNAILESTGPGQDEWIVTMSIQGTGFQAFYGNETLGTDWFVAAGRETSELTHYGYGFWADRDLISSTFNMFAVEDEQSGTTGEPLGTYIAFDTLVDGPASTTTNGITTSSGFVDPLPGGNYTYHTFTGTNSYVRTSNFSARYTAPFTESFSILNLYPSGLGPGDTQGLLNVCFNMPFPPGIGPRVVSGPNVLREVSGTQSVRTVDTQAPHISIWEGSVTVNTGNYNFNFSFLSTGRKIVETGNVTHTFGGCAPNEATGGFNFIWSISSVPIITRFEEETLTPPVFTQPYNVNISTQVRVAPSLSLGYGYTAQVPDPGPLAPNAFIPATGQGNATIPEPLGFFNGNALYQISSGTIDVSFSILDGPRLLGGLNQNRFYQNANGTFTLSDGFNQFPTSKFRVFIDDGTKIKVFRILSTDINDVFDQPLQISVERTETPIQDGMTLQEPTATIQDIENVPVLRIGLPDGASGERKEDARFYPSVGMG